MATIQGIWRITIANDSILTNFNNISTDVNFVCLNDARSPKAQFTRLKVGVDGLYYTDENDNQLRVYTANVAEPKWLPVGSDYEVYKTINFGSVSQTVSASFYSAFSKVATRQSFSINYDTEGGTLECSGIILQNNLYYVPTTIPIVVHPNRVFDCWYVNGSPLIPGMMLSENISPTPRWQTISVDLSELDLTQGAHTIKVRAKTNADDFDDSAFSNSATYTVSG